MGDPSSLGFGHFLSQSDLVTKTLLVVLALMSAISWYLIVLKGISQVIRQRRSARFLSFLLERHLARGGAERAQPAGRARAVRTPDGALAACPGASREVQRRQARGGGQRAGVLTRTIKKVLDEESDGSENGLTMLATIGATAPLRRPVRHGVGRLPRAGGDRHVGIGHARQGRRSGRRGLIMTGIGLAVALPAVMGYNWLTPLQTAC
jgi:biopolymer transport protein ExbB